MNTQLPSTQFAPYLDEDELLDDPDSDLKAKGKWVLIGVGALVLAIVLLSSVVTIGGAVVGPGELEVETKIKRISHATGGIVSEIFVSDGDRVTEGQPLLNLDTTVTGVSAELSGEEVDRLLARRARLEAEREARGGIAFPQELTSRNDDSARAAMAQEARLFNLKRQERANLRSQLNERIRQFNEQIESYNRQISAIRQQAALIEPERQNVRELWEENLVTINRLNQLERTAVDLEGNAASLEANVAQVRARISETREQMIGLDQAARAQAGQELTQVQAALADQTVRSVSAGDALEKSTLRAPHDGVVDKLAYHTIGSFVPPAEQIMEIVPEDDRLMVEARVSPADIDQIRTGQSARVRFTAFNLQTTPEFRGTVDFVSAERADDERTGQSFYRVRIQIDEEDIEGNQGLELLPGMPTETYIETGDRTLMSFLLKPLRDQITRAFREN